MIDFLAGAVTMAFSTAGLHFLRFWRRTHDRLFLNFALAFWLFAANQFSAWALGMSDERTGFTYILRIFGFLLIALAIIDKNVFASRSSR